MFIRVHIMIISFILGIYSVHAQQRSISGTVLDAESYESLAFVHMVINDSQVGTTTDINGRFQLRASGEIERIHLSYVGYEAKTIDVVDYLRENPQYSANDFIILLQKSTYLLKEVVFEAGENPAHPIIQKAVENKDSNNPEKIASFTYKSYNKFIIDAEIDEKDLEQEEDSTESIQKYLEKRYLFLMESVTERKYKYPDRNKEIVLANRVSGLKNPMFTTLANSFQPFTFYDDYITILNKNYLNPISKGSINKYFFWLEDSIFSEGHKVYIISFEPKRKNFDGLKGLLYINTHKYALENVIAETANVFESLTGGKSSSMYDEENMEVDMSEETPKVRRNRKKERDSFEVSLIIKIQQKYELLEGDHWFPAQLNTDIEIGDATGNSKSLLQGKGRSYLSGIQLFQPIKSREFDRMAVEYDPKANQRDSSFWDSYRVEPLGPRGQETYIYLDSVGKASNLDMKIAALGALTSGKIPLGIFDIDLNTLLDFNLYESVRLGFGMHTSPRFSEVVTVGGYGAWAFRDKAFKYGGDIAFNLTKKNDLRLYALYFNDVMESGATSFYLDNDPLTSERRRHFMVENMDKVERIEGGIRFYFLKYLDMNASFRKTTKEVTSNYRYLSVNPDLEGPQSTFDFAEIQVGLKYSFREQYIEVLGNKVPLGTKYPTIWLNYTKGLDGLASGKHDYDKIDFKLTKSWLLRGFGEPSITIKAGYATGDIPYPNLYNGNGSYEIKVPLEAVNSFQAMRLTEFLSSKYIAIYYSHLIGTLKLNPRRSTPTFLFLTSIGFGDLDHPDRHMQQSDVLEPLDVKTMEKGYYESGISIRNIYRFAGVFGLGVGYYYRYGPYALRVPIDNMAFKITLDFSL